MNGRNLAELYYQTLKKACRILLAISFKNVHKDDVPAVYSWCNKIDIYSFYIYFTNPNFTTLMPNTTNKIRMTFEIICTTYILKYKEVHIILDQPS